jgi:hypothetical protein
MAATRAEALSQVEQYGSDVHILDLHYPYIEAFPLQVASPSA